MIFLEILTTRSAISVHRPLKLTQINLKIKFYISLNIKCHQIFLEKVQEDVEDLEKVQEDVEDLEKVQEDVEDLERVQEDVEDLEKVQEDVEDLEKVQEDVEDLERVQEDVEDVGKALEGEPFGFGGEAQRVDASQEERVVEIFTCFPPRRISTRLPPAPWRKIRQGSIRKPSNSTKTSSGASLRCPTRSFNRQCFGVT